MPERVYFRKLFDLCNVISQRKLICKVKKYLCGEDKLSSKLARRSRLAAYKLVLAQAVMAVICFVFFFTMWGVQYGYMAFAGGLIAVLPNFVFVTLAFSHSGASQTDKVLKSFYWGEAVKLLLTIALFSIAFSQFNAAFMPIFVGYLLCLMVHWTAPLYFKQS